MTLEFKNIPKCEWDVKVLIHIISIDPFKGLPISISSKSPIICIYDPENRDLANPDTNPVLISKNSSEKWYILDKSVYREFALPLKECWAHYFGLTPAGCEIPSINPNHDPLLEESLLALGTPLFPYKNNFIYKSLYRVMPLS